MSLIPQITLDQLVAKIQNNEVIPSSEIFLGDRYIGTFIVPSMYGGASIFDEIKTHAEYLGVRGNIVVPPAEETPFRKARKIVDELTCPECGFIAKAPIGLISHMRKHRVKV